MTDHICTPGVAHRTRSKSPACKSPPPSFEQTLRSHPSQLVSDACVAGVPATHKSNETAPRAWIVLTNQGRDRLSRERAARERLMREFDGWVRGRLSRYKWLKGGLEIVDEIPSNPTEKILKRVLVKPYAKELERTASSKL